MGVIQVARGNGLVFEDQAKPWKTFGGAGDGVRVFALGPGLPSDDTTNSPTNFINTQVGTSPATVGAATKYPLLITTGATEYNGSNLQLRGALMKFVSTQYAVLRAKIKLSVADQSDFLFGLCILKTDLLKTSVAHGVLATNVEGVFFLQVAQFAGTLPDTECTPSFNVRNGAAVAVTASVAELGYVVVES
jgi:hypothetical protein